MSKSEQELREQIAKLIDPPVLPEDMCIECGASVDKIVEVALNYGREQFDMGYKSGWNTYNERPYNPEKSKHE